MRLTALTATALLGLLLAGSAGGAAPSPTISNCGKLVRRPASLVIACGDGNYALRSLRWSSWGGASADATGTAIVNDCVPYCAAGHFHSYPVQVTVSHVIGCGEARRYGLISVRFTKSRPANYKPTVSTPFTCKY